MSITFIQCWTTRCFGSAEALRIQSDSRSCAFLVQSRAFEVNRGELGSTADNCSQHTPPENYPTEMQVDHVLDKLYKQVESDDDNFLNLQRPKVIHDKHQYSPNIAYQQQSNGLLRQGEILEGALKEQLKEIKPDQSQQNQVT